MCTAIIQVQVPLVCGGENCVAVVCVLKLALSNSVTLSDLSSESQPCKLAQPTRNHEIMNISASALRSL